MSTATLTAQPLSRPTVHVTRRGRLLVLVVLVALLLAAFAAGRSGTSSASTGVAAVPELRVTTVEAGETLWAVARRIAPSHDPREVVSQIRDLNEMGTATLQAGQQLLLPGVAA